MEYSNAVKIKLPTGDSRATSSQVDQYTVKETPPITAKRASLDAKSIILQKDISVKNIEVLQSIIDNKGTQSPSINVTKTDEQITDREELRMSNLYAEKSLDQGFESVELNKDK